MYKKIVLFSFCLAIVISISKNVYSQKFVEFGLSGEHNKPYYKIIFNNTQYTSSANTDNQFIITIQVSDTEFQKISSAIKECNFIGNRFISEGIYYLLINCLGEEKKHQTSFIEPLELIFNKIVQIIINKQDKDRLKNILQQTLWRLGSNFNF